MKEADKNPYGVKVGEFWKENDPRHELVIEVRAINEESGKASIYHSESGKLTIAKLSRFHGKRGGYARMEGKDNAAK